MIKAPFTLLRFCTKTERKTSVFVKVLTVIRTKTPQKRRFSKTLSKVDIHKNGGFLKTHLINVNAQKRRFLKMLQYATMSFTKTQQCERTKTEVFLTVFVRKPSSVNGSFDATKTDTNKNGVVSTGPNSINPF